jgi:uncharacterized cupredoxin-like copper-binding protein
VTPRRGGSWASRRPILRGALTCSGIALVVAACAGGGSAPIWTFPVAFAPATARSTGAGAPSPSAAATQTVTFVLKEYAITPATVTIVAGEPVTFVVRNAGTISHALVISGGGVNLATKDLAFQPGAREQIASTLAAGTYTFTCPVDGHANLGMKGTLIVTP